MEENTLNQEVQTETKTYTQEEVDLMLQQEGDRRVTQALKKQEQKQAERIREAEKLAQMNEQEKYVYQLEQREKKLAEKERELALAENKNEASKILAEKGISLSLVDFVVADDAETMKTNIDILDRAFKMSVREEVERRLATTSPKKNFVDDGEIDRERFNKLGIREQQELLNNNPQLKNMLFGG